MLIQDIGLRWRSFRAEGKVRDDLPDVAADETDVESKGRNLSQDTSGSARIGKTFSSGYNVPNMTLAANPRSRSLLRPDHRPSLSRTRYSI